MHTLVRKTLETYLREQRVITLSDIDSSLLEHTKTKSAVFVTLYYQGKVIASSGRIQCKKENTLYECIDNTLMCLKDPRFTTEIQNPDTLGEIHIRVDIFSSQDRRVLQDISELDTRTEGIIFLSVNFGKLAVVLPGMVNLDSTPMNYLDLACKKV
jgi:AMMECR1 domain-containing protein